MILPLEHTEDASCTAEACDKFITLLTELRQEFGYENSVYKSVTNNWRYGVQHHNIILKYGRYPSRNAILEREPIEAEKSYDGPTWGAKKK